MKRKAPTSKRRGWKESPSRPLTPAAKKRRAEYLRDWRIKVDQLRFVETERR